MRKIVSLLMLSLVAAPAFAEFALPEPDSLLIFAMAGASMFVLNRFKRK